MGLNFHYPSRIFRKNMFELHNMSRRRDVGNEFEYGPNMVAFYLQNRTDLGDFVFDYGIRYVTDQAERAKQYVAYMKAALGHPQIVGTHWFRYKDQSPTGRHADGANAQNGFLDLADTPYVETVEASRQVGRNLYEYRTRGKWPETKQ